MSTVTLLVIPCSQSSFSLQLSNVCICIFFGAIQRFVVVDVITLLFDV